MEYCRDYELNRSKTSDSNSTKDRKGEMQVQCCKATAKGE